MTTGQRILIAPLDWGLGHAARCIPLITRELESGNDVTIACSDKTNTYLSSRFPELEIIRLPGYGISYHTNLPVWFSVLLQSPRIFKKIKEEHRWLDDLLKEKHFDTVISDNRYGLYNKSVRSIIITHQLRLRMPKHLEIASNLLNRQIRNLVSRFDECHVPDEADENSLSGELSHGPDLPANTRYIGLLSRFEKSKPPLEVASTATFKTVILLSGPEPKRSILEHRLVAEQKSNGEQTLVIRGVPGQQSRHREGNITFWNDAYDSELAYQLKSAKRIICRPGYSTLMDLMTLGVQAELIPTPGQTEQEYLAKRMSEKKGWTVRLEK